ncbi:MAG: archaeal proteasome endopeptidase complex subunit alpha [Thermoplasmata archaeon]|nr:archaeal proteasome endopeptidase complex subunit alpha [Thermoplasmata archaeon]
MQPGNMAYDRAITVFSPDGRLFQVEYAREAVKRGTTTVGLKYRDGVILIIDKRITSPLIVPSSIEKIFKIDEFIGCATSGLVADARVLVDRARIESQVNKITYNERIPVDVLVKKICDFKQNYTQYGGVRPFGTALLIAGVDEKGVHLYETDPSGAMMSYKAGSIGSGRSTVMEIFEEKYKSSLSMDQTINLGLSALLAATDEGSLNTMAIEIGVVKKNQPFSKMDVKKVVKYVKEQNKK